MAGGCSGKPCPRMASAAREAHRGLVSLLPAGQGSEPWPVPTQRDHGTRRWLCCYVPAKRGWLPPDAACCTGFARRAAACAEAAAAAALSPRAVCASLSRVSAPAS
jgi:hypothetical protein